MTRRVFWHTYQQQQKMSSSSPILCSAPPARNAAIKARSLIPHFPLLHASRGYRCGKDTVQATIYRSMTPAMGEKPWYLRGCGCPSGIYIWVFFRSWYGRRRVWISPSLGAEKGEEKRIRSGLPRFTELPSEQEAWKLIEPYRSCLLWFFG